MLTSILTMHEDAARGRLRRVLPPTIATIAILVSACSSSGASPSSVAAPSAAPVVSAAPTTASSVAPASPSSAALPDSALIKKIKAAGTLKSGVAISLPAVGLDPNTGKYFGAGVDLAQMMADKLGVKLEVVPTDWNVMVAGIQSGQIDVATAGLFITPERTAVAGMSPWAKQGFCWAVLKTNNKINSLADLNSPTVTMAQQEGGGTYQLTKAKYPLAKQLARLPAPGEDANWAEVLSGKADTAPFDSTLAAAAAAAFPEFKIIAPDCATHPDSPSDVGTMYPKDDPGFKAFVEQLLADNKAALQTSYEKYLGADYLKIKR